jgi:hypothetical protein
VNLYGVWITDTDGSNGRWMTCDGSMFGPGKTPWTGSQSDAEFYANERRLTYRHVTYAVKVFKSQDDIVWEGIVEQKEREVLDQLANLNGQQTAVIMDINCQRHVFGFSVEGGCVMSGVQAARMIVSTAMQRDRLEKK